MSKLCLLFVKLYHDSEKKKKILQIKQKDGNLLFCTQKLFSILLCSPSSGCQCLDLLMFVGLGQNHNSWHMESLRMYSLMK